ncbi:hypothetical protein CGC58_07055 [Capnocytophaga stomatis]|uniref:Lipoprotein n=1 Tax=Capnocytophaga stomatis TaxID=1848904 RepID=A0A250FWR0_9FLAO|nr:hypothetical protein [Capnocytophaga stomatis]ATA89504.1 hypothetical protein CGC58_07055 [Capnocytophaga stomatis]
MVKKILLLVSFISILSCKTSIDDLQTQRKPYLGKELRTDGYYYSNVITIDSKYDNERKYIYICIFYKNGVCYNIPTRDIQDNETILQLLENLEKELLLNPNTINDLRAKAYHIGVFQINSSVIEMETFEGSMFPTFKHYGEILNDTTFLLHKIVNSKTGYIFNKNLMYKFKQFSPKPDSTSVYIK